ncbi:MAG: tetratricopeptide repeat protein [Candidatus Thermoplasmatota archaeon]|nr:tetratricopeptide repeat protein [Candidatus Thermoplasmatota archaeon]
MAGVEKELMDAQEALAVGEFEKAVSKFNKVIKADPKCADAHFGKAEASVGVPKLTPEDVMESYKKAVELDPKNPIYQSSYAAFLIEIGRFNEAEAAYLKAAELDPDNARYYFSEFGVEYTLKAPIVMEKFMDDNTRVMIMKKGLKYLLKAAGMTEEDAKKVL